MVQNYTRSQSTTTPALCGALVLLALGGIAGSGIACRRDRKVLGGNAG